VRESRRIAEVWIYLVVGWTDPEGSRPYLGALLLAYYDPNGGWSMPVASAAASTSPSLNGSGFTLRPVNPVQPNRARHLSCS
jgi:hypothetical protein